MRKKLLILGAGGYVGGVLYKLCSKDEKLEVYGTYNLKSNDTELIQLNVMDTEKTNNVINKIKPDIIIWSLASKKEEVRLAEIGLSNLLNKNPGTRFIYISTTFTSDSNQKEDYIPKTLSGNEYLADYVNGKILGEQMVRTLKNHVIIRTGQIFGFDVDGNPDIRMKRLLTQLNKDDVYYRTANNRISVIHVHDLADCILELCFNSFIGTINISSKKSLSHFSFYKLLAEMLNIDDKFIVADNSANPQDAFLDVSTCSSMLKTKIKDFS